MQYDPHHNFLVTGNSSLSWRWCWLLVIMLKGSWDSTATVWDPRQTDSAHCTAVLNLPGKAYSLSLTSTRIVVATSERHIVVYDSRNLSAPEQVRESPLRYQTRKVSCFPNGEGFALGSIEVGTVFCTSFTALVNLFRCTGKGSCRVFWTTAGWEKILCFQVPPSWGCCLPC